MSLIDLTAHFKRNPWLTQKWVGPLSAADVFYLYKIREAAKEYLADNPAQMDAVGYSQFHHEEFMAQFYKVNDLMFKAHDTLEFQHLDPEIARGLKGNLQSIGKFLQTIQIPRIRALVENAEHDYGLSTQVPRLHPHAVWTQFDEQELRRRNAKFQKEELERVKDLVANSKRIRNTLSAFCDQADIGAQVIPLHQDTSPK